MIEFNFDSIAWRTDASPSDLLRLRRHYAANVSMIDQQVGRVMRALDERGYLDNALVIFTSDHADALGDHGHIQKWTMYDCVLRVPLIVWSRNLPLRPGRRDELVQMFDIAPTVLEAAGLKPPPDFEARSLWGSLSGLPDDAPRQAVYAELARDHIQTGSEFIVMRRDRQWKIVVYLDDVYGELYDLQADPGEVENLWNAASLRTMRDALVDDCLRWLARGCLFANRRDSRAPQQAMRI
jgi:arylsulfatase A-like enzyme